MPSIRFVPTRATFGFSLGQFLVSSKEEPYLSFRVRPEEPWRNHVKLATGEKFQELKGHVYLSRRDPPSDVKPVPKVNFLGTPSPDETTPVIGQLAYFEGANDDFDHYAAGYTAELWITPSKFDELLAVARIGKMPVSISIELAGDGITYGNSPDGSDKDWDNKAHPYVPIIGASFALVLAAHPVANDDDPEEGVPAINDLAPTRAQATELLKLLQYVSGRISALPVVLLVVGALLVAAHIYFSR